MPVIRILDLTKVFKVRFGLKRVCALDALSLDIEEGEIFGFVGPNGAGKTTAIKIIMGLLYPSSGSAEVFGKSCMRRESKYRIGFLPEQPYFYQYLNSREVLSLYGSLFGMDGREVRKRGDELLERVGLRYYERLPLRKFSKGMLQRVGLAQALINDPDLVILDEPMSGLDPMGRLMVRDIILDLHRKGKTIFFSSHILSDVEMICDRVGILVKGRLRAAGYISDLLERRLKFIEITVKEFNEEGERELERLGFAFERFREFLHIRVKDRAEQSKAIALMERYGGDLVSVIPRRETLDDILLQEMGMEGGGG